VRPKIEIVFAGGGGPHIARAEARGLRSITNRRLLLQRLTGRGAGSSATPMSTDVCPFAGPFVAANVPSNDRNSTTVPRH
jgi:hypothetical protein